MRDVDLVFFSDTHGQHSSVKIPKCDILIFCGDWSKGSGSRLGTEEFIKWIKNQPAKHKVVIAGNHEINFRDNEKEQIELFKSSGIILLNHESIRLEGLNIFGSPWTPYFFDWAYNAGRNEPEAAFRNIPRIKDLWAQIPHNTDILVTHGPPLRFLDQNKEGENCGCADLQDRINGSLHQLKIHAFGHIHEQGGKVEIYDKIAMVNASIVNRNYKLANEPVSMRIKVW